MSPIFAGFSALLLIASPWADPSATWTLYAMGACSLAIAAIFYLSND
jgi:hypothetical protein